MKPLYNLYKSPNSKKKYMVIQKDLSKRNGLRIIHFGAKNYEDYTIHKNEDRKNKYIARHKKNENWNDLKTAGAWSVSLLWNKKTLNASIRDMEKKFNIIIRQF